MFFSYLLMNIEKVLVNKKIEITYQLFYVSRGY